MEVGTTLAGRFRLTRELGAGGYGAVYLAKQLSMDRDVAIKLIHPHLADAPGVLERFEREARVASKLAHPNLVVYFDFGSADDVLFLAMEYVEGSTLSHLLRSEGPLSAQRTIALALQIAGGLEEAHRIGLVHRDLKPPNILLTRRAGSAEFVKIIDFGLAKVFAGDGADSASQDITSTGMLLGTPAYMAPEQIRGQELDHRCDIYALGIIMFLALSGTKPYAGSTPVETAAMHLTRPTPRLSELGGAVPAPLEALVARCMSKEREARPSAEALIEELSRLRDADLSSPASFTLSLTGETGPPEAEQRPSSPAAGASLTETAPDEQVSPQRGPSRVPVRAGVSDRMLGLLLTVVLACLAAIVVAVVLSGAEGASSEGEGVGQPEAEGAEPAGGQRTEAGQGPAVHPEAEGPEPAAESPEPRDERPVVVEAAPRFGEMRVNAEPWGRVFCEGEGFGETPVARRVETGRYSCTIVGPLGQSVERTIRVREGTNPIVSVRFD